jgi:hypothetical protein
MIASPRVVKVFLGAATACAVIGVALAQTPGGDDPFTDRTKFLPKHKLQPLPGKVIGVLAQGAQSLLRSEGRQGPADALCLGTGEGSYRWLYVPVKKRPLIGALNVPVGTEGRTKRFDSLGMANPQTVKPWGITGPYALVEVEVNGGLGSPSGDAFVATHLRQLDGTKEYPLRVAEVIEQLRRRYETYLREQDAEIQAALIEAQRVALRGRRPTGPREKGEILYVTWLPESQRLRVRFQTRISDGEYQAQTPQEEKRRPTFARDERVGTSFGVELGMAYEVNRTGQVEGSQKLALQAFQKVVPPRGVARGTDEPAK